MGRHQTSLRRVIAIVGATKAVTSQSEKAIVEIVPGDALSRMSRERLEKPRPGRGDRWMFGRRAAAGVALVLFVAGVVVAVIEIVFEFPRGLVVVALLVGGLAAAWHAVRRRGHVRHVLLFAVALLLVAAVVVVVTGDRFGVGLAAIALLLVSVSAARRAFAVHAVLPAADPPRRPIVVWNPRSGGGKAVSNNLADAARARGIEPIELRPGDDLEQLVRDAVTRGADGLAAAGGDGTQALVASIAAEHDLPFACIPAGTRNHFALDLGVDRDDVVGALDAFVDGGERRVDLAEVNGRVFVNNASLGLYAEAVQREGYRDAKLRTILDTAPDVLGSRPSGSTSELGWRDEDGTPNESAAMILVSNNPYRLGHAIGSGTRPRIDERRTRCGCAEGTATRLVVAGNGPPLASVVGARLRGHLVATGARRRRRGGARSRSTASVRQPPGCVAGAHRAAAPRSLTVGRAARGAPPRARTTVLCCRRAGVRLRRPGRRCRRRSGRGCSSGVRSSSPIPAGLSAGRARCWHWWCWSAFLIPDRPAHAGQPLVGADAGHPDTVPQAPRARL